jgi:hypothetical protein
VLPHLRSKSIVMGYPSQIYIDNPVTTLLHYPRKVVRLAFRETPQTIQI